MTGNIILYAAYPT